MNLQITVILFTFHTVSLLLEMTMETCLKFIQLSHLALLCALLLHCITN